jgi:hypothetical protein
VLQIDAPIINSPINHSCAYAQLLACNVVVHSAGCIRQSCSNDTQARLVSPKHVFGGSTSTSRPLRSCMTCEIRPRSRRIALSETTGCRQQLHPYLNTKRNTHSNRDQPAAANLCSTATAHVGRLHSDVGTTAQYLCVTCHANQRACEPVSPASRNCDSCEPQLQISTDKANCQSLTLQIAHRPSQHRTALSIAIALKDNSMDAGVKSSYSMYGHTTSLCAHTRCSVNNRLVLQHAAPAYTVASPGNTYALHT